MLGTNGHKKRAVGLNEAGKKAHSLRFLERIKASQALTAREERRKEEVLGIFRELYRISDRRMEPPDFPPWHAHW